MTNASSIQNLIKNVGCAVGTSSVGFLVSSYAQIYQHYLVDRLNILNNSFVAYTTNLAGKFLSSGYDSITSDAMANIMVYKQLLQQSTLCAYINAYKIYAVAILLLIPLVIILKKFKCD